MKAKFVNQIHQQHGFSMVEVLVAMVVLSIGLLGMAGMYVTTLRSGSSAIYRMQAVNLAADLADRIRANRNAVASYGSAAGTTPACMTAVCAPPAMAANDLFLWNQQIATLLPGSSALGTPAGTVTIDNTTTPFTETIKISWTEPGSTQALSYTLVMQL